MSGPHFSACLLTTAYLPPVDYFFAIAHSDRLLLEQHENYQKQSWRSRCRILSAGGPEDLSIPVVKEERRSRPIRDIRIDYGEPWLQHHIRAFSAAYNASAYYDYYADDLIPILEAKPVFLFDLNLALLEKLLALLDLSVPVLLTDAFVSETADSIFDGRARIQPKCPARPGISSISARVSSPNTKAKACSPNMDGSRLTIRFSSTGSPVRPGMTVRRVSFRIFRSSICFPQKDPTRGNIFFRT